MVIAISNRTMDLYDDKISMILSTVSDKYLAQVSLFQDAYSDMTNIKILDLNTNYIICDETYPGYLGADNIFICNNYLIFRINDKFNLFQKL